MTAWLLPLPFVKGEGRRPPSFSMTLLRLRVCSCASNMQSGSKTRFCSKDHASASKMHAAWSQQARQQVPRRGTLAPFPPHEGRGCAPGRGKPHPQPLPFGKGEGKLRMHRLAEGKPHPRPLPFGKGEGKLRIHRLAEGKPHPRPLPFGKGEGSCDGLGTVLFRQM